MSSKQHDARESQPLLSKTLDGDGEVMVYTRRWWLLFIVCAISFSQGCIWNNWGPISDSVQTAFDWSDGTIALMANWGPICYLVAVIPSSWIMDTKGSRSACLVASGLVFFGALARCFTSNPSTATGLIHLGQIFNGLAGPVAMSIPPVLSATWFPAGQRTTATAVMAMSNYVGVALAFIMGPELMPAHSDDETDDDVSVIKKKIMQYMWIQAAFTAVVFLSTLIYFPNRPPHAPSRSAEMERMSFLHGLKALARHKQFWLIAIAYGVITGIYSSWSAYLQPNLQEFLSADEAQDESGWIGFYGTMAGCASGIGVGMLSDKIGGKMKLTLTLLCALSTMLFLWFALACQNFLANTTAILYVSSIIGGFFLNGTIPLFIELGVETTYPIAEGITTGLLTTLNNLWGLIFLVVPEIPGIGNLWANWALVGACAFSMISMVFFREHYRRTSVDLGEDPPLKSLLSASVLSTN